MKFSLHKFVILSFAVVFLFSCGTVPKPEKVPMDLGPEELTMLAQIEIDKNNNRGAKAYFEIMVDRYGHDPAVLTAGEFEIAHILIKQRKYARAEVLLKGILERFQSAGSVMLPQKYRKLAEIDLNRIKEKTKKSSTMKVKNKVEDESITIEPNK